MDTHPTRRQFLITTGSISAVAPLVLSTPDVRSLDRADAKAMYDGVRRWGLTNISEKCVADYDVAFWREQWKRTGDSGAHRERRVCDRHVSKPEPVC